MSVFSPDLTQYDRLIQPLTLCGKAATLEQLTPRRDPQQIAQARQAASDALRCAFASDIAAPDASRQKGAL